MGKIAYIALGSNIGDCRGNLDLALQLLQERGVQVLQVADYIVTAPYGVTDQPEFVNSACKVATDLEPLELLHLLLSLELEMGRVRKRRWGERNIDLDLIFYENEILDLPDLKLPHIDMQNRDFVLLPMVQLAPDFVHPVLGKTMSQLLAELQAGTARKEEN